MAVSGRRAGLGPPQPPAFLQHDRVAVEADPGGLHELKHITGLYLEGATKYGLGPGAAAEPAEPAQPAHVPSENVLAAIHVVSNRISRAFYADIEARHGITLPEWRVMLTLTRHPGMAAMAVAELWGMDKMAISRAVRRLERSGLVPVTTTICSASAAVISAAQTRPLRGAFLRSRVPSRFSPAARIAAGDG